MKNILKIMVIASAAFVAAGCNALDIMQDNKLSASNMWKTSVQVESSTYGIYSNMRSNFIDDDTSLLTWGELRVGEFMWGPSEWYNVWKQRDVLLNNMTASTGATSWSALYSTIDQANAVIKYAASSDIAMTDAKRKWALGQAYFARAFCYFYAVRLWGDVPLNLQPIESTTQPECYPFRAPKADVLSQIGADIESALQNADFLGSDKHYATAVAVNMLKADWALWMYSTQDGGDGYLAIAEAALSAIGIKQSLLADDYGDIFDRMKEGKVNKTNKEVVFSLYNSQTESKTGGYSWYFAFPADVVLSDYKTVVPINETQWMNYGKEYLKMLRDSRDNCGDTRVKYNLGEGDYFDPAGTIKSGHAYWCNKYAGDLSTGKAIRDCDIIYYRAAYAVMLDAECKYYRGNYQGALNSLNIIAKRAYGQDAYYKSSIKADVLDAIVHEYFLEFPAEGQIWWALVRLDKIWDYNSSLAERKTDTNILLWPISKSARNKNPNLTQTEGWY